MSELSGLKCEAFGCLGEELVHRLVKPALCGDVEGVVRVARTLVRSLEIMQEHEAARRLQTLLDGVGSVIKGGKSNRKGGDHGDQRTD